jgi:hypothetical protein
MANCMSIKGRWAWWAVCVAIIEALAISTAWDMVAGHDDDLILCCGLMAVAAPFVFKAVLWGPCHCSVCKEKGNL